jgi:hypothetical protein
VTSTARRTWRARAVTSSSFSDGKIQELAAKPVMRAAAAISSGTARGRSFSASDFKFNDFIQAIHRMQRFLQTKPVRIDLIYTEAEREVRASWSASGNGTTSMVGENDAIIREYGLAQRGMAAMLAAQHRRRAREASGESWRIINNDCVEECARMAEATAST